MANLLGLKVAILIENGFEQVEMTEPRKALDEAGATTSIVSPRNQRVRGWNFSDWGEEFPVERCWKCLEDNDGRHGPPPDCSVALS